MQKAEKVQKFQEMMLIYNKALEAGESAGVLKELDEKVKNSFVPKW